MGELGLESASTALFARPHSARRGAAVLGARARLPEREREPRQCGAGLVERVRRPRGFTKMRGDSEAAACPAARRKLGIRSVRLGPAVRPTRS
eukprot:11185691-Lingulodinium_polyedra.AAC.1